MFLMLINKTERLSRKCVSMMMTKVMDFQLRKKSPNLFKRRTLRKNSADPKRG
jgi:hypothetical protein